MAGALGAGSVAAAGCSDRVLEFARAQGSQGNRKSIANGFDQCPGPVMNMISRPRGHGGPLFLFIPFSYIHIKVINTHMYVYSCMSYTCVCRVPFGGHGRPTDRPPRSILFPPPICFLAVSLRSGAPAMETAGRRESAPLFAFRASRSANLGAPDVPSSSGGEILSDVRP